MKNKVSSQIPQMETNPRPIVRTVRFWVGISIKFYILVLH